MGEPGWSGAGVGALAATGELRVRAARVGGRTVLAELYRSAPFHLGLPSYRGDRGDGAAEVVVQQVGPGLFPGERLRTEVAVGAGAALTLRGQSATKVYPCPDGRPAVATTALTVAVGGRLVVLPGEVIPYRDAIYRQATEADVACGGRLALAEIVTPGRLAMGEAEAYRRVELRARIRVAGRPVLIERVVLNPPTRAGRALGRQGAWPCAGTLVLVGFGPAAEGLGQAEPGEAVWWGSGGDAGLVVVRLLGETAQAIRAVQGVLLARVSSFVG